MLKPIQRVNCVTTNNIHHTGTHNLLNTRNITNYFKRKKNVFGSRICRRTTSQAVNKSRELYFRSDQDKDSTLLNRRKEYRASYPFWATRLTTNGLPELLRSSLVNYNCINHINNTTLQICNILHSYLCIFNLPHSYNCLLYTSRCV